jgi:hypothetical protein
MLVAVVAAAGADIEGIAMTRSRTLWRARAIPWLGEQPLARARTALAAATARCPRGGRAARGRTAGTCVEGVVGRP